MTSDSENVLLLNLAKNIIVKAAPFIVTIYCSLFSDLVSSNYKTEYTVCNGIPIVYIDNNF